MSSTSHERSLFAARIVLLLLVALAPWPFGSATPRFAAALVASVMLLAGSAIAWRLSSQSRLPAPPGFPFLVAALALALVQQVPWPSPLVSLVAPGVEATHAAAEAALGHEASFHPLSVEPFQTRWWSLLLLGLALAFYLGHLLFSRGRHRRALGYTLAAGGVALSLFAVYQKARFGTVLYGRFPVPSGTPFGPFVNHNHFAGWVEASALVTLGLALETARRRGPLALLLFGAAGFMGIALALSESRGGLLATFAGALALAWLAWGAAKRGPVLLGAAGLAVLVFLVAFAPGSVAERWTRLPEGDDSVAFRVRLWTDSLGLASASPILGSGLGTYAAAIPPYRRGPDETRAEFAESDWIQALCETGVLGLAVALGLLVAVLRAARWALDDDSAPGVRQGAFAAVVALSVHGLVDFNLHVPSNALLFAVLLGVLASGRRGGLVVARRGLGAAAAALVAALAVALALHTVRLGESRALERRVDPVLTDPDAIQPTIQALLRSRNRVASNPRTAFLLGRLYNEEAYRSAGQRRYRDVRLGQASAAFREAVRLAPARGRYWFELAWTEANRGNDDVAGALFPRALELEPHWANLRANYALFLASRGRVDEALDELQIGRSLEPGLEPLDALRIVGPYLGDDERALERVSGTDAAGQKALARYREERRDE